MTEIEVVPVVESEFERFRGYKGKVAISRFARQLRHHEEPPPTHGELLALLSARLTKCSFVRCADSPIPLGKS